MRLFFLLRGTTKRRETEINQNWNEYYKANLEKYVSLDNIVK